MAYLLLPCGAPVHLAACAADFPYRIDHIARVHSNRGRFKVLAVSQVVAKIAK